MQRITDLVVSVIASMAAFSLSWPFWRNFDYWAESHLAWKLYFGIGFILAVYLFYVFMGSMRMLFLHAADEAVDSLPSDGEPMSGGSHQS
jgi:hypothetical protein